MEKNGIDMKNSKLQTVFPTRRKKNRDWKRLLDRRTIGTHFSSARTQSPKQSHRLTARPRTKFYWKTLEKMGLVRPSDWPSEKRSWSRTRESFWKKMAFVWTLLRKNLRKDRRKSFSWKICRPRRRSKKLGKNSVNLGNSFGLLCRHLGWRVRQIFVLFQLPSKRSK